jgi:transcription elongation factor S-II
MVKLIKLNISGEVDEVSVNFKKNEKFSLNNLKRELLINNKNFKEQHEWDLDNNKVLKLFGSKQEEVDEENFHQLPIKDTYQFYGDLYTIILHKNVILDLDIENFENIYNALYFDSDDEEESETSEQEEEEDEADLYNEQDETLEDSDEDLNLDNYGDDANSSDNESLVDVDEKKKSKNIKKKKVIKIQETKDILYEENVLQEKLENETRYKVLELLYKIDINKDIGEMFFREVEMELFNYAIRSSMQKNIVPTWNILLKKIYINKVRSLYTNLVPNSYINNKRLFERMRKGEFTAHKLVNMTIQELFPEHWKHLIDEKYRRNKILYETKKEAMTDQFKCRKCKSRETCYYEMQTRSADEPMTIFITCLNCGNRWKN